MQQGEQPRFPVRPVLMAGLVATALWGMTQGLDNLLDVTSWGGIIVVLALVDMAYLGLQYLFLRAHLMEKREV